MSRTTASVLHNAPHHVALVDVHNTYTHNIVVYINACGTHTHSYISRVYAEYSLLGIDCILLCVLRSLHNTIRYLLYLYHYNNKSITIMIFFSSLVRTSELFAVGDNDRNNELRIIILNYLISYNILLLLFLHVMCFQPVAR